MHREVPSRRPRIRTHSPRPGTLRMNLQQSLKGKGFSRRGRVFSPEGTGFSPYIKRTISRWALAPEEHLFARQLSFLILACSILFSASKSSAQTYLDCHFAPGFDQSGPKRDYTSDNLFEYRDGAAEGYLIFSFT